MVSPLVVAQYILSLSDPEAGDLISNLKLQKLLYYCQGFHLALTNRCLFEEDILKWTHGPVVPSVYDHYREFGSGAIPVPTDADFDSLTVEHKEIIKEVYEVYGQFSAWMLRNMTHDERPWIKATVNKPLSISVMKEFFRAQLIEPSG